MCSRHNESNGADSDYTLQPYLVLMRDDDGDRICVLVSKAMGKHDARNQARLDHPDYQPLDVSEALLDYADAELQKAKEAGL